VAASLIDQLRFLGRFLLRPKVTGAVAPSSPQLVAAMLEKMGVDEARAIAELGPGTGVATVEILRRLASEAQFLAVEKDPAWVALLRRRHPELDVEHGDASELDSMVQQRGIGPLDVVICGLPFAILPQQLQSAILDAVIRSLKPGGGFSTFAYVHAIKLPAGQRFRALLEERFAVVQISDTVWRNTPPAIVYRAWSAAPGDV
jgi:phospholipid N-methyltransferase